MTKTIREIGERLRDLREIFGYSPVQVARQLKVDPQVYDGYENGEFDIPIGFLYEAAHLYHVELTALLTGGEPKLNRYALSRGNGGIQVDRNDDYHYRSLAFNFTGKIIEPLYVVIGEESSDAPIVQNSHPGQEWDYVLSGTLRLQIENQVLELHPGDSIYFDSSIMHGMKAVGGDVAFLAIILENVCVEV